MRLDHLLSKELIFINITQLCSCIARVVVVDDPSVVMPPSLNRSGNTPAVIEAANTNS